MALQMILAGLIGLVVGLVWPLTMMMIDVKRHGWKNNR